MDSPSSRRPFWRFSAVEVRAHALITAVVLWGGAVGILSLGTTYRDPFDQLKWTDFVHFYTLGQIVRDGPLSALYDANVQHQRQIALVPASAPEHYLPVYPPQVPLIFAPLAGLPYHAAAAVWAILNLLAYAAVVWSAWMAVRAALPNVALVAAAAAAFPPFWSLVLNGQTAAIPMLAFSGCAAALSRGRRVLAGAALGVLLMKPQFGLLVAVVVLVCGEWALLFGIAISAVVQTGIVAAFLGTSVLHDYVSILPQLVSMRGALEPKVGQMHSIATVARLLPGPLAVIAWVLACGWVAWLTVRVWRSGVPTGVAVGALAIGSVLINPHVNLYDVTVLAAPLVWLTGWCETGNQALFPRRHQWRLAVYALFLLTLLPTARVIGLQLSPFALAWLLHAVVGASTVTLNVPSVRAVRPGTDSLSGLRARG